MAITSEPEGDVSFLWVVAQKPATAPRGSAGGGDRRPVNDVWRGCGRLDTSHIVTI
jgi:hypothetical protein